MNTLIIILCVIGLTIVALAFALVMDLALCWLCRKMNWKIAE